MSAFQKLSDFIDESLSEVIRHTEKPDNLFHYTSQSAFQSIVSKGELWLTNVRTMNDPWEGSFGVAVIRRLLAKFPDKYPNLIDIVERSYSNNSFYVDEFLKYRRPTYLMSFSRQPDFLPDWINYGANGSGLCVQFPREKLVPAIVEILQEKPFVALFPVFYFSQDEIGANDENKDFVSALYTMADKIEDLVDHEPDGSAQVLKPLALDAFMIFAVMIKSVFHQAENEWRLIVRQTGDDNTENIDSVMLGQSLRTIYKIHFPDRRLGESPLTVNQLGSIIDVVFTGPKLRNSGIEQAIWMLTLKRWKKGVRILPSDGALVPD